MGPITIVNQHHSATVGVYVGRPTLLDNDTNQRMTITGFNSAVRNIRLFSSPADTGSVPQSLAIYYSTLSTTSLTSSDSNYTGANGGVLVPMMSVSPASFNHPIAGSTVAYMDLFVSAPAGTRTLLVELGAAAALGDRVSEIQAFVVPEPGTLAILAMFAGLGGCRCRGCRAPVPKSGEQGAGSGE